MSKTHSQSITKETGYLAVLVIGLLLYITVMIILLTPGIIDLLTPAKTNTGTDAIDTEIVNEAIKLIQPQ